VNVLVHDYSGHPFQAQLSRSLARRGHTVVHSSCAAYVSGKGDLDAHGIPTLRFATIGGGKVKKHSFLQRSLQEAWYGLLLVRQLARERPDRVMIANAPIPTLVVAALYLMVRRVPWVLWHQDVQAVAVKSLAGDKLGRPWLAVAEVIRLGERWCARRAARIVVIAESFVPVHQRWGTAAKVTVIPNWAPLDEIVPMPRENAWSREHGLAATPTLLYSGTLGLKHSPELLPMLAARVRELTGGKTIGAVLSQSIPDHVAIRVHDSTADMRYMVLPMRPAGTEGWSEERLAALVTRDSMIGTGLPLAPEAVR
jgi:colanic acid biosynthesis glycosyl transferase WcaI